MNAANSISLIVALIAALVAILGYAINQLQIHRERRAKVFAEALSATVDYIQIPYIIGTRSVLPQEADPKDRMAAEASGRADIGKKLREIQARLYFHQSLIQLESVKVARAYNRLVLQARLTGSVARKEAWRKPPISSDEDFTIQWSFRFAPVEDEWRECLIAMRRRLGFRFRGRIATRGDSPAIRVGIRRRLGSRPELPCSGSRISGIAPNSQDTSLAHADRSRLTWFVDRDELGEVGHRRELR